MAIWLVVLMLKQRRGDPERMAVGDQAALADISGALATLRGLLDEMEDAIPFEQEKLRAQLHHEVDTQHRRLSVAFEKRQIDRAALGLRVVEQDLAAGDGARLEGDVEAAGEIDRRSLRRAHIGAHRHVHADIACSA